MLKFITGNKNKFAEVKVLLSPLEVEQLDINTEEIQELDPEKIIRHKLEQAAKLSKGDIFVEDSLVYLECLNNKLPGPFIRWFSEAMTVQEMADMRIKLGKIGAEAKTLVGYCGDDGQIKIFEGSLKGTIVLPRGDKDFGYGPIFQPEGFELTYGEMGRDLKNKISSRAQAISKLKDHLLENAKTQ